MQNRQNGPGTPGTPGSNGTPANSRSNGNYRRNDQPIYVETVGYAPHYAQGPVPYQPNEVDPGMNGDGWQGPGGRGAHHMNGGGGGGGRRGGMHNQRMPPGQHHGGMNRGMLPPGFRHQPQQSQFMGAYPQMGGMPPPPPPGDMMDISMRMGDMSLSGYGGEMAPPPPPPQGGWNQPTPFGAVPPQDDLYDGGGYGGANMPPHHAPFGQRGGGNQYGGGGRMQQNRQGGGGYQQRNHQNGGYMQPMMGPPMGGNQQFYSGTGQQSFAPSPFSIPGGGSASQMGAPVDQMGGGGGGGQNGGGFQVNSSSMDDYSMWTDENDEDAKRKKVLRDKGLNAWGDADVSNSKPIRRWIVPEGQEEDFDTAMARCPSHLKKKTLNEEALRRRLVSDNPQIVAQAQQQVEEEANATMRIGRRPIIPCGWGDLPPDMIGEKSDFDQGSSKGGWEDEGRALGLHHAPRHQEELGGGGGMPWNLPGVGAPSSSETRNPFFAHHMQQQQAQQQLHLGYGDSGDNGGPVWNAVMDVPAAITGPPASSIVGGGGGGMSSSSGGGPPLGMLSNGAGDGGAVDGSQMKLAEHLKLAVEKGHLDISLLSLPHIPPNVLDLLTEILTVIPRLDAFEDELKKLAASRPSNYNEKDDPETWMTKDQKNEHDKAVIGVVTSKIEVTQLSKKITEALIEHGLIAPPPSSAPGPHHHHHHHHQGPPPDGGAGPSTSSRDATFNGNGSGGPPEHYYDYSFLG